VGIALSGEAAARLLQRLAMPTSADTVLRLVRALPLPEAEAPRVLGVDDWALKKGPTYGTILVDLAARRVVDLLPERTAPALAGWLEAHPTIEAVVRERSSEYGRGATLGAPEAVQVADRWHLLYNLRQMLGRWLAGIHGRLQALPALPAQGAPTRRTRARIRAPKPKRPPPQPVAPAGWPATKRFGDVFRRAKNCWPSAVLGAWRAARCGALPSAERFPERAVRVPPPSILDPYLGHLEARLAAGCENATALWRELQTLGFGGSSKQVHRWVSQRRTAPAKNTARSRRTAPASAPSVDPPSGAAPLPSPRQLAWRLVQAPEKLEQSEAAILARLAQDAEVARGVDLAQRLAELVRRAAGSVVINRWQNHSPFWPLGSRTSAAAASRLWKPSRPGCSRMRRR
jgi:transposase